METITARTFASSWLEAWNAHDLEAILSHFSDDAVFTSPIAAQMMPETGGVLNGKDAIRVYWTAGLERIPDLHFSIEAIYTGVDTVVINYRNHIGSLVCEVLRLVDGLVNRGDGTYLYDDAAGASGVRR
jgi:ketosteroid isomerase-like protein